MDVLKPKAVVGTNSWGSAAYEKLVRGASVDEATISDAVRAAIEEELLIFDTAQDYGLGKGQAMIGRLCQPEIMISSKYTPGKGAYTYGQVRASLEKDLKDFGRDSVEIYWLHLPNDIEENFAEMIELYREGKVRHIGISNFNLEECKQAKAILDKAGVPLYGVQNHYSVIAREWEENGLVAWCRENGVSFWAWAVLEEGILVPRRKGEKGSIMKLIFRKRRKMLCPLHEKLGQIGAAHGLTVAETAISFCSSKGIVPVCGCRKREQVQALSKAVSVTLTEAELSELESVADSIGVTVLGADMFRFAVDKRKKAKARS